MEIPTVVNFIIVSHNKNANDLVSCSDREGMEIAVNEIADKYGMNGTQNSIYYDFYKREVLMIRYEN